MRPTPGEHRPCRDLPGRGLRRAWGDWLRRHQALPLPRLPAGDPSGHAPRRRLARPRLDVRRDRPRRTSALARRLLASSGLPSVRMRVMAAIRANSVLPARREAITLETADGLALVGELALPEDRDPVATLVCLHPLPTHGGMMDSHVFRKASFWLPALAGIAVLRYNSRGTTSMQGTSEGAFDHAKGERYDVAAAIEYAEFEDLPNVWVVGWSFGTDLALMHAHDPAVGGAGCSWGPPPPLSPPPARPVRGAFLLPPPLRFSRPEHLGTWAESGKP